MKHNEVYGLYPGAVNENDESITMNKNQVYGLTNERLESGYENQLA